MEVIPLIPSTTAVDNTSLRCLGAVYTAWNSNPSGCCIYSMEKQSVWVLYTQHGIAIRLGAVYTAWKSYPSGCCIYSME